MKLTVLMENTALTPELECAHGLSLYLETGGKRILMDVGPGEEFLRNAKTLNIALKNVDFCVISHGHYDHGGGLGAFLREKPDAPVYLSDEAFTPCCHGEKYIGLDQALRDEPGLRFIQDKETPAPCITLLGKIPGDTLLPEANRGLEDGTGQDMFRHELILLAEEGDRLLLLGGCGHRGIVNILEHTRAVMGRYPDAVVSGFHLAAGGTGKCLADEAYLDALAGQLLATGAKFYTCHCTGHTALDALKSRMGDALEGISAGSRLEF